MMTVNFYDQRHGTYTDDSLNPTGELQVAASAKQHLDYVQFHEFMASDIVRAQQTLDCAGKAIGYDNIAHCRIIEPGFGFTFYDGAFLEKLTPYGEFLGKAKLRRDSDYSTPVSWVLETYYPSEICRQVLLFTMRHWAERFAAKRTAGPMVNVLVGGHATNSWAAPDTENTEGVPDYADIHLYTWYVDDGGLATLEASKHLPAPPN